MDDTNNINNQNVAPVDYLNNISPATPEMMQNQNVPDPQKPSRKWLVIAIIVVVLLMIAVIIGVAVAINGRRGSESGDVEIVEPTFEVVEDDKPLPYLGANYEALGMRNEGLVTATRKSDGATVVLDDKNNLVFVLNEKYSLSDYEFHDGRLPVICEPEGKYGYLDSQGNLAIGCNYDYAQGFVGGVAHTVMRYDIEGENAAKVVRVEIDTNGNVINTEEEIMEEAPVAPMP